MLKKRVFAIIFSLLMVMAIASTAFAADQGTNSGTGEGTISITGTTAGKVYDIYRIFDLTGRSTDTDPEFENFAYTVNENWIDFFFGTGAAGAQFLTETQTTGMNQLVYNGTVYYILLDDDNVADFAQAALPYAVSLPNNDGTKVATGNTVEFENAPLGYYLVYPQGAADIADGYASLCSLTTTKPSAVINQKAEYPEIEKEVDQPDAEVGQTVVFTVTGQIPDTTGYETYIYQITDTMDAGILFDGISSVKVFIDGATVPSALLTTDSLEQPNDVNGFVLTFDMTKYQDKKGQSIEITYSATVTEDAVCQVTKNKAVLKYSNNPNNDEDYMTQPPIEVPVYSSMITVNKVDEDEKPLEGASFVLGKIVNGSECFYKFEPATPTSKAEVKWYALEPDEKLEEAIAAGKITEGTSTLNGEGDAVVEFPGLSSGDYFVRETVAPDGFSLLTEDVDVTVSAPTTIATTNQEIGVNQISEIENKSGTELPETGGVGTKIFYIIGSILLVVAAVLLITMRRVSIKK